MCSRHQRITAIIYDRKGNVLSIGKNNYTKSHPVQAFYAKKVGLPEKIYPHAEIDAIIRCDDISKAHRIDVFRILRDGSYGIAKPCKICMSAIEATNIKIINHT